MVEKKVIKKKIKKQEGIDFTKKTEPSKGVGRKKLLDKELSKEMLDFSWLVGMGMEVRLAGRKIGLSDYQIKSYAELPKVIEHIALVKSLREDAELGKWLELDNSFRTIAIQTVIKIASQSLEEGGVPDKKKQDYMRFLLGEWDKKRLAEGLDNKNIKVVAKRSITKNEPHQIGMTEKEEESITFEEIDGKYETVEEEEIEEEEIEEEEYRDIDPEEDND